MVDRDERLRADARANRDKIVEVARDAFASDPEASLNAIAKAAGVGAGTLYRHFPNREALVLGVYHKEVDTLAELAPMLLGKHPPVRALRLWCDRLLLFGRTKHGVAEVLQAVTAGQDFRIVYGPMLDAVRSLLHACESNGDIRPGLRPEDFLLLVSFLWRLPADIDGQARARDLLAIVFDGLQSGRPENR